MRRLVRPFLAVSLLVMMGTVFHALPASAAAFDLQNQWLVNDGSGMCLGIPQSSLKEGVGAIIWPCDSASDQLWDIHSTDDRYVELRRQDTLGGSQPLCLTDPGGSSANGTRITQSACTDASDQLWRFNQHDKWEFNNRTSGKDLAASGGAMAGRAGDPVIQWAWSNNSDQKWYVTLGR